MTTAITNRVKSILGLQPELDADTARLVLGAMGLVAFVFLINELWLDPEPKLELKLLTLSFVLVSFFGLTFPSQSSRIIRASILLGAAVYPFFIHLDHLHELAVGPILAVFVILTLRSRLRQIALSFVIVGPIVEYASDPAGVELTLFLRLLSSIAVVSYVICRYLNKQEKLITENRRVNRELVALQNRQEQIFATIGHELRTPAATIKMLLDDHPHVGEKNDLNEARELSQHLLAILDDMRLTLSNDQSLIKSSSNVVRVFETLSRAVRGVLPLAEQYSVTVELIGQTAHPEGYQGSTKGLLQIVQNLTKNAVIHSEGNHVCIRQQFFHTTDDKTRFRITVEDNGNGISEKFQSTMFDPYARGDSKADGTGLGLHVCREIARTLPNGDLTYRANPNGGSIFELSFELHKRLNRPDKEDSSDKINILAGMRILVVEDTPTLRMLSCSMLERIGADVRDAIDGVDALALIEEFEADLILTDIHMPRMNGYELTSTLRNRGINTPIVGVTGATTANEANMLIKNGANAVIAKPISLEALSTALSDLQQYKGSKRSNDVDS